MSHLPIEHGFRPPCGARAAVREYVQSDDEAPTCLNCRRIWSRRRAVGARVAGACEAGARRWSDERVREMLASQARFGPELIGAARERGMPIDSATPSRAAATWLRTALGLAPRQISIGW